LIEYGIDHAGFVLIDEGISDVDVFRNHHPSRYVVAVAELVCPRPQHGTQYRFDALERPALLQGGIDHWIKPALLRYDAGCEVDDGLAVSVVREGDRAVETRLDVRRLP
jgi:hypothetical protein